ncbi:unnamed protein product [Urochloa humidicola]
MEQQITMAHQLAKVVAGLIVSAVALHLQKVKISFPLASISCRCLDHLSGLTGYSLCPGSQHFEGLLVMPI